MEMPGCLMGWAVYTTEKMSVNVVDAHADEYDIRRGGVKMSGVRSSRHVIRPAASAVAAQAQLRLAPDPGYPISNTRQSAQTGAMIPTP
jgi:hypothetical protein